MSYLRLKKDALEGLNDLLVISNGRGGLRMIAHSPKEGIVSARIRNDEGISLSEAARLIDKASLMDGGIYENIPLSLETTAALRDFRMTYEELGGAIGWSSGYSSEKSGEKSSEINSVIRGAVSGEVIDTLELFDNLRSGHLSDALAFLSCGDTKARMQALRAYPMLSDLIINRPDLAEIIDDRGKLGVAVARTLELNPTQYRQYSAIERDISALMFYTSPSLSLIRILNNFHTDRVRLSGILRRTEGDDLELLRTAALQFCKRTRPDQMPDRAISGNLPPVSRSSRLSAILTLHMLEAMEKRLGVGPVPVQRALQGIKEDQWDIERARLSSVKTSGSSDYLSHAAHTISYAIILNRAVTDTSLNLERIEETASGLAAGQDQREEDVEELISYIEHMGSEVLPFRGCVLKEVMNEIGDHSTLKLLGEMNTRWHRNSTQLHGMMREIHHDFEWRPLVGQVLSDGFRAREIHSSRGMTEQGERENHCVGGYSSNVLGASRDSVTLIFSIERETGSEVVSTLEMEAERIDGHWCWSPLQNLASGNNPPEACAYDVADAVDWALSKIPAAEVDAYIEQIRSAANSPRDRMIKFINAASINLMNPRLPEESLRAFDAVLPKSLRGRSPRDWEEALSARSGLASSEIDNLIHSLKDLGESLHRADEVEETELGFAEMEH